MQQVVGPIGHGQLFAGEDALQDDRSAEYYLAKGLTGMARAQGWFDAHWGAAVLAGHYLCAENELEPETVRAIRRQLDAMIRLRTDQFELFPEAEADQTLVGRIPEALLPAMQGGLRAHGHAVIFAALSLRALREAPQLAQPQLIDGLCGLSRQIARIRPQQPANGAAYENSQAIIDALFDSLARFQPLLGRPTIRRPNFTHMTTHTEALLTLDAMGYRELVAAGHAGHQAHVSAPVPMVEPSTESPERPHVTLEKVMSQDFWANEQNLARWNKAWNESGNPNGYWVAFGHLFKVLYSYQRLIDRVEDKEQVELCSRILLERYVNPEVRGG
jgi:hypothetical protein